MASTEQVTYTIDMRCCMQSYELCCDTMLMLIKHVDYTIGTDYAVKSKCNDCRSLLRLTTPTVHQGCMLRSSGVTGRYSLAMLLFTRHSSFFALHLFMMAMYSLRPIPTSCTMSAAWKQRHQSCCLDLMVCHMRDMLQKVSFAQDMGIGLTAKLGI